MLDNIEIQLGQLTPCGIRVDLRPQVLAAVAKAYTEYCAMLK
jgi:hypothetical protein